MCSRTKHGIECGFVTGDTPDGVRAAILGRFRSGELKYLCNVNVLTTGFDAPHIDCVARWCGPTMSPGLYYQMVGRGFRLHPGKTDCLVLDFGGNVLRHGPVDAIRIATDDRGDGEAPAKECPNRQASSRRATRPARSAATSSPSPTANSTRRRPAPRASSAARPPARSTASARRRTTSTMKRSDPRR